MPDIVQVLSQGLDFVVVGLAIAITQLIKWILPTPAGADKATAVSPTMSRILPIVPLCLGVLGIVVFKEGLVWREYVKQGLSCGVIAAYLYRTAKVSFFGG